MNPLKNLDEILENISKIQNPTHTIHDSETPESLLTSGHKNSDILYLTIGIIAGILLILIIILIVMCILRILQRKKFICTFLIHCKEGKQNKNFTFSKKLTIFFFCTIFLAHVKTVNDSEFYCDGLRKNLNPDYATTPCLQHGVVAVDGKLIPFAYPTNPKQALLWNRQNALPHTSTAITTTENGIMHLNANPINDLDNENTTDMPENFYHTLTPFSTHGQYEEYPCLLNQTSRFIRDYNYCLMKKL